MGKYSPVGHRTNGQSRVFQSYPFSELKFILIKGAHKKSRTIALPNSSKTKSYVEHISFGIQPPNLLLEKLH